MKFGLHANFAQKLLTGLVMVWLGSQLPRLYGSVVWNTLNVAQLKSPESMHAACPPFYSGIDDCLNIIHRWLPHLSAAAWESAWQLFMRADYIQAAKAAPVTCSDRYTPGAVGRRAQYVIVELLALADRGCASNADSLWRWMMWSAPFYWPPSLQPAVFQSGAIAHEWLAAQGFEPVARQQLAAAELWWLADERAHAARLINDNKLASSQALTSAERGWASFYLGVYAEDSGDSRAAFGYYSAALDNRPNLIVASAAQYRLATRAGDAENNPALGRRLIAFTPSQMMAGDGVSLAAGYVLIGYEVQPLAVTGPWLHLTSVWRLVSTVNNQPVVQRCVQSTVILNLSRFDWSNQSKPLTLAPSLTSSMQPELLSFPIIPPVTPVAGFILYGMQVDDVTARVTITVRMLDKAGQALPDKNQSLTSVLSPGQAKPADGYSTYAVDWPGVATEGQVLLTLHAANAPVEFSRILVAFLTEPGGANAACVEVTK